MDNDELFGAPPRRTQTHEIGQNLDDLSVGQIEERIALLKEEIRRLEQARSAKQASRDAAAAAFKI